MIPDILFQNLTDKINGKYPSMTTRLNKSFLEVWIESCDKGGARRFLTNRFCLSLLSETRYAHQMLYDLISEMIQQFNKELEEN